MFDFFTETGPLALGSRLRRLADRMTEEDARIYRMYGHDFRPKWFPVLSVLDRSGAQPVTAVARSVGQSHPSVCTIIREMKGAGLVAENRDSRDGRRNLVSLTEEGERTARELTSVCEDMRRVVEEIATETKTDLWAAIEEWEQKLREHSLVERIQRQRHARADREVRIVPYEERYRDAFRRLNEAWITAHWQIEEADREALDHPKEHILDAGGEIFVALLHDRPVGVCALCRPHVAGYDFELAKLAVSPRAQGYGIGYRLCRAVVERARERGGRTLFLESNRLLKPAIHLYRKLGFRELAEQHPAYARGDIQMELELTPRP